jgi:predicted PurR-regulated permease PerM
VKIKSLHIKNKTEIFGIAVITSLFAGALISNLGSTSITVFAQDSQNATQQQPQDIGLAGVLALTQNLRTLIQESGLNTTASSPGELRDRVQQFTNGSDFEQFSQRLSQFAQQSGLNMTRLESASPDGDIMSRLQNFTEFVEAQRAGSNMTSSQ